MQQIFLEYLIFARQTLDTKAILVNKIETVPPTTDLLF